MVELTPAETKHSPLLEALGITTHIDALVLLGQGPVQDSRTKVKTAALVGALGVDSAHEPEANSWMRLIARAGATLFKTGEVGLLVPSGGARGDEALAGRKAIPAESDLMMEIVRMLTPETPEFVPDKARNTLWNLINAASTIDARGSKDAWIVCAHFHKPRVKALATLFGFDSKKVLSAEEVMGASATITLKGPRGEHFNPRGFDRQQALKELMRIRLETDSGVGYFARKKTRAEKNLRKIPGAEDVMNRLYIEEQKSAKERMRDERRWARGIAMESQYVLPLLGQLQNDTRLLRAVKFFGMSGTPQEIRNRLKPDDWRWDVVPEAWKDEVYPPQVKERLSALGLSAEDIDSLSSARVPAI